MRKIGISIPSWNRDEILFESFEKVYDDPRVASITIVDDQSDMNVFVSISEKAKRLPKIKLMRNLINKDCYVNKMNAVSFSEEEWIILLDSDNKIDTSYLDRIYDIPVWDKHTAYMPSYAKPLFSYEAYSGITFSKENIASYIDKPMVSTCLNCMNYFINATEYLRVWQPEINPYTADSILQNYNWFAAGKKMYIVPGCSYEHRVHNESHYKLNNHKTGKLYNEIELKLRSLK